MGDFKECWPEECSARLLTKESRSPEIGSILSEIHSIFHTRVFQTKEIFWEHWSLHSLNDMKKIWDIFLKQLLSVENEK